MRVPFWISPTTTLLRKAMARHRTRLKGVLIFTICSAALALSSQVVTGCPKFNGLECAGHGTCVHQDGGVACQCAEGYIHADCSTANYCIKNCSGFGTCIPPSQHTLFTAPDTPGTCVCHEGFSGPYCEELDAYKKPPPEGIEASRSTHA